MGEKKLTKLWWVTVKKMKENTEIERDDSN